MSLIHVAAERDEQTMCGLPVVDIAVTAQPASSTCEPCFQAALDEMERLGVEGFLGNPEGRT